MYFSTTDVVRSGALLNFVVSDNQFNFASVAGIYSEEDSFAILKYSNKIGSKS